MYMYWDQPIDAHTDADLAMALDLATLIAADTDDFFTFYCAEAEWLRAEVVNALLERHMLPKPPKGTALKAKRRRKAQQTRRGALGGHRGPRQGRRPGHVSSRGVAGCDCQGRRVVTVDYTFTAVKAEGGLVIHGRPPCNYQEIAMYLYSSIGRRDSYTAQTRE